MRAVSVASFLLIRFFFQYTSLGEKSEVFVFKWLGYIVPYFFITLIPCLKLKKLIDLYLLFCKTSIIGIASNYL